MRRTRDGADTPAAASGSNTATTGHAPPGLVEIGVVAGLTAPVDEGRRRPNPTPDDMPRAVPAVSRSNCRARGRPEAAPAQASSGNPAVDVSTAPGSATSATTSTTAREPGEASSSGAPACDSPVFESPDGASG